MSDTALIALDWGTSSLRAFRIAPGGGVLETRASGHGIQHLPQPGADGFAAALSALTDGWPDAPLVACGMVGSAQGWAEVPYLPCPADVSQLSGAAGRVQTPRGEMLIAPGLIHAPTGAPPDVMRGEEIQIAGAIVGHPDRQASATLILPGTHCKWAQVQGGAVTGFATYMTGEIFAVLRAHSILGRLMPDESAPDPDAFARGVAEAASGGALSHQLFSARTLGLTGQLPSASLAEYMSGLLIGHEVAAGLAQHAGGALLLVGGGALCARYDAALRQICGAGAAALIENPAPLGLYHFARAAGLIPEGQS
ncbi:2-dehydro-3-deoxygalactonokinase [Salipiger sp. 1_MG-2023]|uniref:2-dehydro-3-deoxygalactonokinase n=1 Tax=Salipiger sp. 1_MG-2023 TaxID=3062665 RepID=UPI0026E283CE|nr:2-dehydro-3-deoxygalactonokinase [Salipiger sp. 1_MG-2023]MDO6584730.1 2-dehydro-3-deoxygalactonokinase [Salipiger sp. 1_MG-2023]